MALPLNPSIDEALKIPPRERRRRAREALESGFFSPESASIIETSLGATEASQVQTPPSVRTSSAPTTTPILVSRAVVERGQGRNTGGSEASGSQSGGNFDINTMEANTGPSGTQQSAFSNTYAFEHVFARLVPFHWPRNVSANHPIAPIMQTGGLVFPYNPTVSEGVSVKYDQLDLTHSNESYYAWNGTENVQISISDAVWTCDTFDNAVYALSVLHFLRSYSFSDFGRFKTGRPPSPMWFSAFGNYAFNRVPCLLQKADWSFPNDIDFVGIPEFGSPEYQQKILQTRRNASGKYTWLPVKFTVSSISLVVQHSPTYWINWSLEDYWSGAMLERDGNFHTTGPSPDSGSNNTTSPSRSEVLADQLASERESFDSEFNRLADEIRSGS